MFNHRRRKDSQRFGISTNSIKAAFDSIRSFPFIAPCIRGSIANWPRALNPSFFELCRISLKSPPMNQGRWRWPWTLRISCQVLCHWSKVGKLKNHFKWNLSEKLGSWTRVPMWLLDKLKRSTWTSFLHNKASPHTLPILSTKTPYKF